MVRVKATGSRTLANPVGRADARVVPPSLHISPQYLTQAPALLGNARGRSQAPAIVIIGTVSVERVTGSGPHGIATLSAPTTGDGQPYILSATVEGAHDALTGVSSLQLVPAFSRDPCWTGLALGHP